MTDKVVPVFDRDGKVVLFDRFRSGKWIGSRRTMEQAIGGMNLPEDRADRKRRIIDRARQFKSCLSGNHP